MISNRMPRQARLTLAQRSNLIPLTASLYDRWRERSMSLLTGEHYPLEREFRLMLDWLEVQPGQRFLDVGTSTGNYAGALACAGGLVTAIDIARPMLERAQARLKGLAVTLEQASAEALPYRDSSFDGVVIGATINEFHSTGAALHECARVLKPDGRLFLMYLCRDDTLIGRGLQAVFRLVQVRFPEREEVRATLNAVGLERRRAEVRKAIALELFIKTGRPSSPEPSPAHTLPRLPGKRQLDGLE